MPKIIRTEELIKIVNRKQTIALFKQKDHFHYIFWAKKEDRQRYRKIGQHEYQDLKEQHFS